MKEIIHVALREALSEKQYNADEAKNWTKDISNILQTKLKGGVYLYSLALPHPFPYERGVASET